MALERDKVPRLVICAGLPRSASTWVYNATLMLLRLRTNAAGVFSDTIPEELSVIRDRGTSLVVKCHAPNNSLIALASIAKAPIILTIRDPRDCLVSLNSSFGFDQKSALQLLKTSASALLSLSGYNNLLSVKYEDSIDREEVLASLAAHLGVALDACEITKIANELSLGSVKKKIARWETKGVLDVARPIEVFTRETHWHANHCGDALTGKYVEHLSLHDSANISAAMKPFFAAYGYVADVPPAIVSNRRLKFDWDGIAYVAEGFSYPEHWGVWTEESIARIVLPLARVTRRVRLEIIITKGPCLGHGVVAQMFVNGRRVADVFDDPDAPGELMVIYDGPVADNRIEIEFRFENLASPRDLGLSTDDRRIGVGVRSLCVSYNSQRAKESADQPTA